MVKNVFVFPGQGAQENGMVRDICESIPQAKKVLEHVSQIISEDITKLLWESEAQTLSRSDKSQLATAASSLVVMEALKTKGILPDAVAGFSLGEWPALYASGVLSLETMITAVKKRGEIMQAVCEKIAAENEGNPPGMSAIIGLETAVVAEKIKERTDVFAANLNSKLQTVIAGTAEGLTWAEEMFKNLGARRCIRLKVAGPFHSPLMQKAADEFAGFLESISFSDPKIALFSNVTGSQLTSGKVAKENAIKHIASPLLWTTEEKSVFEYTKKLSQKWRVIEAGFGTVLTKLWKDTDFAEIVPVYSCGKIDLLEDLATN